VVIAGEPDDSDGSGGLGFQHYSLATLIGMRIRPKRQSGAGLPKRAAGDVAGMDADFASGEVPLAERPALL